MILPTECKACGAERCTVSVGRDGAVWFMPSHMFNTDCPVLQLVQAIGRLALKRANCEADGVEGRR